MAGASGLRPIPPRRLSWLSGDRGRGLTSTVNFMHSQSRQNGPAIEAHFRFLLWIGPTVENFPRDQKFILGDRIQKTVLDVLEALIEATYTRERRAHLARANLGLEKLRFFFRIAVEMHYLDKRRYEYAARSLDETGRLIGGWMKAGAAQAEAA